MTNLVVRVIVVLNRNRKFFRLPQESFFDCLIQCIFFLFFLLSSFTKAKVIEDREKVKFNENNVPPAQLQKTPLNRKGILAAVPIC